MLDPPPPWLPTSPQRCLKPYPGPGPVLGVALVPFLQPYEFHQLGETEAQLGGGVLPPYGDDAWLGAGLGSRSHHGTSWSQLCVPSVSHLCALKSGGVMGDNTAL